MKLYVILNIFLCYLNICLAQEQSSLVSIDVGKKEMSVSEPFVISVIIKDVENRPPVVFPEFKGLEKKSKSATSSINTIDGNKVFIQTISQEYYADKIGVYEIPDFIVLVNGVKVKSEGFRISFGMSAEATPDSKDEEKDVHDVDLNGEEVFFSVKADKKSVYVREGFSLGISLYIAESAMVQMEFYEFNRQLPEILRKLRPTNCWEENVGIEEIVKRQVRIKGKKYTEYNMYQAQLFPITRQDVILPAVSLNMLVEEDKDAVNVKHKIIKTFRSKASIVHVKALPPHPLMDQVAVGRYTLSEKLSSPLVYPGESVRYEFKIQGIGNIAAIPTPVTEVNSALDFYPPERSQEIKRSYAQVSGQMTFDYFVVPRKDGVFPLNRYFQWIYFDPVRERYDTLQSVKKLQVKGEDYKLGNISLSGSVGLYDNLDGLDTTRESFNYKEFFKNLTNAIVVVLVLAMFWVFRK